MGQHANLTNQRFGKLVAIAPLRKVAGNVIWFCQCDCGGSKQCIAGSLRAGYVKSCGCLRTGGHFLPSGKRTRAYNSWYAMLARCRNPKVSAYRYYGGRGISVCERWLYVRELPCRHGRTADWPLSRPHRRKWELRAKELQMGKQGSADEQSNQHHPRRDQRQLSHNSRSCRCEGRDLWSNRLTG
jgi:hypothetical protein